MSGLAVYGLLVVIGVAGAIGDATLNHWARSNRTGWLVASYLIWIGVATLFGLVLKWDRFSFGAAVSLALLVHAVVAVGIDRIVFGERLGGWQAAGIACACAAVVLIEAGRALETDSAATPTADVEVAQR
jgi:drug/metabolite transporter (DMT)-like permease